jgi:hypothetical protein
VTAIICLPVQDALAESTHRQLALEVRYLKAENQILRSHLPQRVLVTPALRGDD